MFGLIVAPPQEDRAGARYDATDSCVRADHCAELEQSAVADAL
jgi:hypothetical protein